MSLMVLPLSRYRAEREVRFAKGEMSLTLFPRRVSSVRLTKPEREEMSVILLPYKRRLVRLIQYSIPERLVIPILSAF